MVRKSDTCIGRVSGAALSVYDSLEDAQKRADIIKSERGLRLEVYECEHSGGWHLTKDSDY